MEIELLLHHPLEALGWTTRLDAAFRALGRPELIPARVAAVHRGRLELLSTDGPLHGAPSGRMSHAAATAADLPATGDWVAADPASGVVHALLPRKGGIARAAGNGRAEPQVLAAKVRLALGGSVPVLAVSVVDGNGIGSLEAWLEPGRTAVLLGSSGVGKTSLL